LLAASPVCIAFYDPTPNLGTYDEGFVLSLGVQLPGMQVATNNLDSFLFDDQITIRNDSPPTALDSYGFGMSTPSFRQIVSPTPTDFGGVPVFGIDSWFVRSSLSLRDDDGSVFDDALIPASLPAISEFESTSFFLSLDATYFFDDNFNTATAPVFNVAGFVVPEPTTGSLLGSAVMVLVWVARRSAGSASACVLGEVLEQ
jgi:hypothetical protein